MIRSVILPALALVALTACEMAPVDSALSPAPGVNDCQAPAYQPLLGQSQSVLGGMLFAGPYRIIRPGDVVTADLIENRVNFELDGAGRIAAIRCY